MAVTTVDLYQLTHAIGYHSFIDMECRYPHPLHYSGQ